jgi:hypothetical protein
MNFALADAERKERMGDARGAQAALAEARKFQQDANRAQGETSFAMAQILQRVLLVIADKLIKAQVLALNGKSKCFRVT